MKAQIIEAKIADQKNDNSYYRYSEEECKKLNLEALRCLESSNKLHAEQESILLECLSMSLYGMQLRINQIQALVNYLNENINNNAVQYNNNVRLPAMDHIDRTIGIQDDLSSQVIDDPNIQQIDYTYYLSSQVIDDPNIQQIDIDTLFK